jgi:nitric oxide reductase NorQ protein
MNVVETDHPQRWQSDQEQAYRMDLIQYRMTGEPFYRQTANERSIFQAAAASRIPLMLKGPTGCGKTRFVEYMAWTLDRPLITVACHEDMTAADLAGRYLLTAEGTIWNDGPLTTAVRHGAMCYLDEIVEARQDTTVLIHPLTDNRRILPLDRKGELVTAHPDFLLVVSYNPGYQSAVKDLKESTRQRFVAIDFNYPSPGAEAAIVASEAGVDTTVAVGLVDVALSTRNLRGRGLNEGASTRMIVHAARLVAAGVPTHDALRAAMILPLTDDADMREALEAVIAARTL